MLTRQRLPPPLAAFAIVLISGCAHLAAPPPPATTVSEDGRSVTMGGETWTAPEGVVFYQRGATLHVVSNAHGRTFDVAVSAGPDGKPAWPADAPFEVKQNALQFKAAKATGEVEVLVDGGQLHPHDDHYHLTHRFENADWQALYRLRADDSPLPPIRRTVAATVLALLLDERIPGTSAEATDKALKHMVSIIGRARRAIEGEVGARAVETIITHDFEILDGGRTIEISGQRFRAAEPLRFTYCSGHFHVEEASGKWAQPVEFDQGAGGAFAWPTSIFFEIRPDGTVGERAASTRWRRLSDTGQVRFTRDHWHLSDAYASPRFQYVLRVIGDGRLPERLRDRARAMALDIMRLRLDTGSDAEFGARLDAIDRTIDLAAAELEKEAKGTPASSR